MSAQTAVLPQDQDPGCLPLCLARGAAGRMSGADLGGRGVPFTRCRVMLPPSLAPPLRGAGEAGRRLPFAPRARRPGARVAWRGGIRTVGSGAADRLADSVRIREAREPASSSGRPAPPPAAQDRAHLVASVEQLVYRQLQESPSLEPAPVNRLVALDVETLLGVPPDSGVLDEQVHERAVFAVEFGVTRAWLLRRAVGLAGASPRSWRSSGMRTSWVLASRRPGTVPSTPVRGPVPELPTGSGCEPDPVPVSARRRRHPDPVERD